MALNLDAQKKVLKALKLSDEAIAAVMADGEFDIELPNGVHILSDDELTATKDRVKKGHEEAYPEIWGKRMNEKHALGLSTADSKNEEKVLAAMNKKAIADAKIEPDKKVTALTADIETLRATLSAKDNEVNDWKKKYSERELNDRYDALIPENANKFLTKEEHRNRLKKEIAFAEDGTIINVKTQEAYKDALAKPIKPEDVVKKLYTDNEGWYQPEGAGLNNGAGKRLGNTGAAGNGGKAAFDADAAYEELSAKYDRRDPIQAAKFQDDYTQRVLDASK